MSIECRVKQIHSDTCKFMSMARHYNTETLVHVLETDVTERDYCHTLLKNHTHEFFVEEACGPSRWVGELCEERSLSMTHRLPLATRPIRLAVPVSPQNLG